MRNLLVGLTVKWEMPHLHFGRRKPPVGAGPAQHINESPAPTTGPSSHKNNLQSSFVNVDASLTPRQVSIISQWDNLLSCVSWVLTVKNSNWIRDWNRVDDWDWEGPVDVRIHALF